MLFVLPFCRHDVDKALRLLDWMLEVRKGVKIGDCVAVCPTDIDKVVGGQIYQKLTAIFERACVARIVKPYIPKQLDRKDGWPHGCNEMFVKTCQEMIKPSGLPNGGLPERVKEHSSFYYFEPDVTPLTADFWEKIQAEYEACGKPCMGFVNHHNFEKDGRKFSGYHMVGTGVYPRDILNHAPSLRQCNGVAWDIVAAKEIMPLTHETKLISHCHGVSNFIHPSQVKEGAVVHHGCKDDTLITLLRGKTDTAGPIKFLHNGDFGDIIYGIAAMKKLCAVTGREGVLLVSDKHGGMREPMIPARTALIRSLLENQGFQCKQWVGEKYDVEFPSFRMHQSLTGNLCASHLKQCHLDENIRNDHWLTFKEINDSNRVAIQRSPRYHNPAFPWRKIIARYGIDLLFLGTENEHRAFEAEFDCKVEYQPTKTILEAAKHVASASLFIGNQSCLFAIAEGLKMPRILEVYAKEQNCTFQKTPSSQYVTDDVVNLPDISLVNKIPTLARPTVRNNSAPMAPADAVFKEEDLLAVNELVVRLARYPARKVVLKLLKEYKLVPAYQIRYRRGGGLHEKGKPLPNYPKTRKSQKKHNVPYDVEKKDVRALATV